MIRHTKQTHYISFMLLFVCLAATPRILQSQSKILALPEGFCLTNPPPKNKGSDIQHYEEMIRHVGDLLWSAPDNMSSWAYISTNFGAAPAGQQLVNTADDFVVPEGRFWTIQEFNSAGMTSSLCTLYPDGFTIAIYEDNGGLPGSEIFTETTKEVTDPKTQKIVLSNPPVLEAGHYWISIYAEHETASAPEYSTSWYWQAASNQIEQVPALRNLHGNFGEFSCKSFPTLGINEPGMYFSLYGIERARIGTINATVFFDKNANSLLDEGEPGIRDIIVMQNQIGYKDAHSKKETDALGQAQFDRLDCGEHRVMVDETTLPEGGVCTTGGATVTATISETSRTIDVQVGYYYADSTVIEEHNKDVVLPWDLPLAFVEGSPSFSKEPWSNAVDKSIDDWKNNATVKEDENGNVWAIFETIGGPCQFDRLTVIPMHFGHRTEEYSYRWAQELVVYASMTGTDAADFSLVDTIKVDTRLIKGDGEPDFVYLLGQTFIAKYVKIVITLPDLGPDGWRQLAEIGLGELDIMPDVAKQNSQQAEPELPTEYSLSQNYPNPFNPVTTISYTLPETQNVDITIYNIKGDLVKQLVSSRQDAGVYNVNWDATANNGHKVTTGVYIYRIRAGKFEKFKKMTLMQ